MLHLKVIVVGALRSNLVGTTHRIGPGRFFIPRRRRRHVMARQGVSCANSTQVGIACLPIRLVVPNSDNSGEPYTLPIPLDPTELIP
jgi:hypothetical protein